MDTFPEGISGTSELHGRKAFLELLAKQANGAQIVLIEKLDRLARDLMVQENLIADIQKRGFRLISVAEPDLLKNDPTRKLMRQIIGAISEYVKQMIVLKLRGALRERRHRPGNVRVGSFTDFELAKQK